jgi:hypothetical protein
MALPLKSQREDTTSFVVVKQDNEIVYDQVMMSFKNRSVGLLPFFCEDDVEFTVYLTQDSVKSACMSRTEAMDNLRGFFSGMIYAGFRLYTADTVHGNIVFLKIFMDMERPEYLLYMYFVIDPISHKINKILVE